jgi:two-component system, chemotaxis family, chemotaxis protein CheY
MRVLVVDDSSTMRRIIINALAKLGYSDTFEASDGREALKCLGIDQADLIVTEWNMPGMTGPQFVAALRSLPAYANTPVLMVTTQASHADVVVALKAGVNGYLIKPFTPDALRERLQSLLAVS